MTEIEDPDIAGISEVNVLVGEYSFVVNEIKTVRVKV